MYELSGTRPEGLPSAGDILEVSRVLKKTRRSFEKMIACRLTNCLSSRRGAGSGR